jgi:hypothetical protein
MYVSAVVLEIIAFGVVMLSFTFAALVLVLFRDAKPRAAASAAETAEARDDEGSVPQTTARMLSDIERLAALKERGALTDKEFATQKAKLLGPTARSGARQS